MELSYTKENGTFTFPDSISEIQIIGLVDQMFQKQLEDVTVLNAAIEHFAVTSADCVATVNIIAARVIASPKQQLGETEVDVLKNLLIIFGSPSISTLLDQFAVDSHFSQVLTLIEQIFMKYFYTDTQILIQFANSDFLESESSVDGDLPKVEEPNNILSFLGFVLMIPNISKHFHNTSKYNLVQQQLIANMFLNMNPRYYGLLEIQVLGYKLLTLIYFEAGDFDVKSALQLLCDVQDDNVLDSDLAVAQYKVLSSLQITDSEKLNTFLTKYFILPNLKLLLNETEFVKVQECYSILDLKNLSNQLVRLAETNLLDFQNSLVLAISAYCFDRSNIVLIFTSANCDFKVILNDNAFDLEDQINDDASELLEQFVEFENSNEDFKKFLLTLVSRSSFSPLTQLVFSQIFSGQVINFQPDSNIIWNNTYHKRILPFSENFLQIYDNYLYQIVNKRKDLDLKLLEQNLVLLMECIGVEFYSKQKTQFTKLLNIVRSFATNDSIEQSLNFLFQHFYSSEGGEFQLNYSTILQDLPKSNELLNTILQEFSTCKSQQCVDAILSIFQHAGCLQLEYLKILVDFGIQIITESLSHNNFTEFAANILITFVDCFDISPQYCAALNTRLSKINSLLTLDGNFGIWASVLHFCKLMQQVAPLSALKAATEHIDSKKDLLNPEIGFVSLLKLALSFGQHSENIETTVKKQINKLLRFILFSQQSNPNQFVEYISVLQNAFADQFSSINQVFGLLQELITATQLYNKIDDLSFQHAMVLFIISLVAFEYGTVFMSCQQLKSVDFLGYYQNLTIHLLNLETFSDTDYLIVVQVVRIARNYCMHEQNQKQFTDTIRLVISNSYKLIEKLFDFPIPVQFQAAIKQVLISHYLTLLSANMLPLVSAKIIKKGDFPINYFTCDFTVIILSAAKSVQWLDQNALEITLSFLEDMYHKGKFSKIAKIQHLAEQLGDYLQNQIEDEGDDGSDEDVE